MSLYSYRRTLCLSFAGLTGLAALVFATAPAHAQTPVPVPTTPAPAPTVAVPSPTPTVVPSGGGPTTIVYDFSPARRYYVLTGKVIEKDQKRADGTTVTSLTEEQIPFDKLKSVRDKNRVVFKIDNVNRLIYDVTISGERVEYDFPMPDAIKNLATTGSEKNSSAGDESIQGKIAKANGLLDQLVDASQFTTTIQSIATPYTKIDAAAIQQIQTAVKTAALPFLGTSQSSAAFLTLHTSQISAVEAIVAGIDATALKSEKQNVQDDFTKLQTRLKDLKDKDTRSSPTQPSELEKGLTASARMYRSVVETGDAFYVTADVIAGSDAIKFTFEIKPNDANKDDKSLDTAKDSVQIPVAGALRVNYSTGIFITWLTDQNPTTANRPKSSATTTADSKTFRLTRQSDSTTTEKIIIDNGSSTTTAVVGALAHIYRKSDPSNRLFPLLPAFQPAFSLGVGTSGDKTQYLIGASAIFGEQQRLIVTVGGSYGSVKRLANGLSVGQVVPDDRSDLTRTTGQLKFMIGLTYNFGSQPTQAKQPQVNNAEGASGNGNGS